MTELLCRPVAVRTAEDGSPLAVRDGGGWQEVARITNRWIVETDWWRAPVRREYRRCLLAGGECVELYLDHDTGEWWVARRYD